jgi:hypothetical protein
MRTRELWIAVAILASVPRAHADDAEATRRADELFNEGKALFATDLNKACEKFEESLRANPQAIGTLLNVALCDEKRGRVASAVVRFTDAKGRAKEAGMMVHQRVAEQHIVALTPRIPYVTIKLAEPPTADTTIVIDNQVIPLGARDRIAIDPGDHAVKISALGRLPYQTTFRVEESGHKDVAIPRLVKPRSAASPRRTIGATVTIGGLAAIGGGVVLGLVANAKYDRQFTTRPDATPEQIAMGITPTTHCTRLPDQTSQCDVDGLAATRSAIKLGNVGTAVGIVGIAATAVGMYLWLRSPDRTGERRVSLVPQAGPGGTGIVAVGRF